jgi:hypothetical protein
MLTGGGKGWIKRKTRNTAILQMIVLISTLGILFCSQLYFELIQTNKILISQKKNVIQVTNKKTFTVRCISNSLIAKPGIEPNSPKNGLVMRA